MLQHPCLCKYNLCTSHGGSQFAAEVLRDESGCAVLTFQMHSIKPYVGHGKLYCAIMLVSGLQLSMYDILSADGCAVAVIDNIIACCCRPAAWVAGLPAQEALQARQGKDQVLPQG